MKLARKSEVLVVGGGPVGLFTALSLMERGVGVQVVDKEWRGASHSYALALHPGSLRLLEGVGVREPLLDEGHRVERMAFYEGEERMAEIDLSKLDGPFPYVLVAPQSALETSMAQQLKDRGAPVLWNHQLMAVQPQADSVTARVARMEKTSGGYPIVHTEWAVAKEYDVASSFLVGADGYHSLVRKGLGSRFEHRASPETFSVFEFSSGVDLDAEARVVFHEDTTNVLWPLRDGRARWSFEVPMSSPAKPTLEGLRELVQARAPWFPPPNEMLWATTALFERRSVDRFGQGRICLAGDAGHITGPVGAQSMNVGLREASDLADAIAAARDGDAAAAAFDEYEAARKSEWDTLLGTDGRLAVRDGSTPWVRQRAERILPCVPASGAELDTLLAQVGLTLRASAPSG